MRRLKDLLSLEQREWIRAAAGGNPFRYEAGKSDVRIGDLVSPMRYDVLLRARHFGWHAQHRDLIDADFEGYQRLARNEPYFIWFKRVMVPRWLPAAVGDEKLFERAWRSRLRASAALHASFEANGFDPAHPIELYAGLRVRAADTGKVTARDLYAGDGNHRLALLMAAGNEALAPGQYRVKRYLSLVPADTTGLLLRETGAGVSAYRSFLELGYPRARLQPAGTSLRVDCPDPEMRAEISAVIRVDAPSLAKAAK